MEKTKREKNAKVYGIDKWKNVRNRLNGNYTLNSKTSNDWNEAVDIFSRRLKRFYINPINNLMPKIKGEGFIIVTAQCALRETFAAFKEGKIYNYDVNPDEIYYKHSRRFIC